ncbi:MAG: SWIM zinc finger family protein [Planctomycetota bacterium]|nr:SWIM zinc finger family protein [Planctomycetota bacterium]
MSAVEHQYLYARPSVVESTAGGHALRLTGAQAPDAGACFFEGALLFPRITSLCLRAIAEVVMTRFYVPPAMLQRILIESDPVVTAGRDTLRFEGFSGCCSTYARLDVGPGGFEASEMSPGTTNVDFQAPLRAALAGVRDGEALSLSVSTESVSVTTPTESIVERKVPLPVRWIKGLGEAQAYLARMTLKARVPRAQAVQFFRGLPKSGGRHRSWIVPAGRGLRLTQREARGAVTVMAVERLRALGSLVPLASELRVYGDDEAGASAWALHLDGQVFTLVLSPERWRGFSGEGRLLSGLAASDDDALLARVRAALNWQDEIRVDALADSVGAPVDQVDGALAILAAQGLVGFDLERNAYFHRVLPFDLSAVEALHPRLAAARRLVEADAVRVRAAGDGIAGDVASGDVVHQVRVGADAATCTCPWYAKHKGERGPCKHVLAVELVAERELA